MTILNVYRRNMPDQNTTVPTCDVDGVLTISGTVNASMATHLYDNPTHRIELVAGTTHTSEFYAAETREQQYDIQIGSMEIPDAVSPVDDGV